MCVVRGMTDCSIFSGVRIEGFYRRGAPVFYPVCCGAESVDQSVVAVLDPLDLRLPGCTKRGQYAPCEKTAGINRMAGGLTAIAPSARNLRVRAYVRGCVCVCVCVNVFFYGVERGNRECTILPCRETDVRKVVDISLSSLSEGCIAYLTAPAPESIVALVGELAAWKARWAGKAQNSLWKSAWRRR